MFLVFFLFFYFFKHFISGLSAVLIILIRDSAKSIKAALAFSGIFISLDGAKKIIDFVPSKNSGISRYVSFYSDEDLAFNRSLNYIKDIIDQNIISPDNFSLHEFNKIKKGFRGTIVHTILHSDFFGYQSAVKILHKLPYEFSNFVNINSLGISLSQEKSVLEYMGYSRFINDDSFLTYQEKSDILFELTDIINEISAEHGNDPKILTDFEEFKDYMLGVVQIFVS